MLSKMTNVLKCGQLCCCAPYDVPFWYLPTFIGKGPAILSTCVKRWRVFACNEGFLLQHRTKFGTVGHFRQTEHAKAAIRTVLYTLTTATIFNAAERQREVVGQLSPSLQSAVERATDNGASSWLSARPIEEHGFALHKGAFRDAVALRYGWEPANLPSHCACGVSFDSCHALTCSKGGLTIARHNEIRDLTASLISEVCSDVEVEPRLQPLSGEQFLHASANRDAEARLDIKARGFWGGAFECAFFDVRVFNPRARTNAAAPSTAAMYRRHEQMKRRAYGQRVRDIEMSSFTPLVFSAAGGFGPAALITFKRIALRLASIWPMPYSAIMGWLRCRVSFALLRSAIMCLRGSRQHVRGRLGCPMLAVAEGKF